jgi:hypothetical protein
MAKHTLIPYEELTYILIRLHGVISQNTCWILGYHTGGYEEFYLLGYDTV